jgi:hypothetical protein
VDKELTEHRESGYVGWDAELVEKRAWEELKAFEQSKREEEKEGEEEGKEEGEERKKSKNRAKKRRGERDGLRFAPMPSDLGEG